MSEIFNSLWPDYDPGRFFCELTAKRADAGPVPQMLAERLGRIGLTDLRARADAAENDLIDLGITFTVYSDATAIDRILPFDCIPRVLTASEWDLLERACKQRVAALNAFLGDIYTKGRVVKDGVIPGELVYKNSNYRPEMQDFPVPHGTYAHICGIDIIRDEHGDFRVLEDNARTPSGVSYVIENRHLMLRTFPDLMAGIKLRPVDDYGRRLRAAMAEVAPASGGEDPQVVLLSPGIYNSAYFEHVFLAREMGVPLVVGADLVVENDRVYMRTTAGLKPVHTIYRRLNDDFLDPLVFRADSMLGVPGLIGAWKAGNVAIANAVGTGVADDKAVYAYMPRVIRYY
ncbi:MAG TPA: circularly permuted type 2 ATP-grasp protein, partial [Acidocella sp.]|nr:circularly permuted type 2 ATP-grasp protein [Acidocella sp.]